MKAQRRHDLRQNVLDAELGKLVGFFRRRGTYILWGVVGAALVLMVAWYAHGQSVKNTASIQSQYDEMVMLQTSPGSEDQVVKGLTELSEQTKIPWIAADACVRLGDVYARAALASSSQSDSIELVNRAVASYRKAIDGFPRDKTAAARGHLGLGQLAESLRNFQEARSQYAAVAERKDLAGYPVAALAEGKLRNLAALEKPVDMATTLPSQPATAPASQPASAPAAGKAAAGKEAAGSAAAKKPPAKGK